MAIFKMPSLGADMDAGVLYEWFIKPGATVRRGDVIASVETDKGVIDIECFEEGVVKELLVDQATRVPVGQPIAILQTAGESQTVELAAQAAANAVETPLVEANPQPPAQALKREETLSGQGKPYRSKVSPAARRLAVELGIDLNQVVGTGSDGVIHTDDVRLAAGTARQSVTLSQADLPAEKKPVTPVARRVAEDLGVDLHAVKGTGPHGAVGRADVEQAAAGVSDREPQAFTEPPAVNLQLPAPPSTPPPPEKLDFATSMRRAIAQAMAKSNREIPHYYLETRIDMSEPLARLVAENQKRPVADRVLPVVLLIRATAQALVEVPDLNGFWRDDHFEPSEAIHIGFAIALRQGGLVTPAIHDADEKSLEELMAAMRDLITRTRGGRLRSSELTDATITLTSLGDTGVDKVYGVIYPPQVALVGFGKIMEQPWAENRMLGIRPILTATLAGDHRASDGRRGAQFLSALEKHLQESEAI